MSTGYVARKMNSKSITEDTIKAWESGEKQPTYIQLEKLAHILEKPLEIFFYPEVPDIPKPSADTGQYTCRNRNSKKNQNSEIRNEIYAETDYIKTESQHQ